MKTAEKILSKIGDKKAASPVTIAFFGDSVTAAAFEDDVIDNNSVYHNILYNMIKERLSIEVKILNFGVNGETATDGLKRIGEVLSAKPDLCVAAFGLNDCVGGINRLVKYENAMREIIKTLLSSKIEVIILTQNMMNTKPANKDNPHYEFSQITAQIVTNGIQESYVNAAKDAANQYSVPVADCFSIWKALYKSGVDTDIMLSNGVNHPTRDAHKIFADELYKVMFLYK